MRSQAFFSALIVAMVMAGELSELRAAQVSGVKPPRKLKDVKPVYPARSLLAGDEGAVLVELSVAASGAVTDARVIWSKCPALDEAALKAARGWEFEKVLLNGQATPFRMAATVPFRLPEKLKSRVGAPGACLWVEPPKPTFTAPARAFEVTSHGGSDSPRVEVVERLLAHIRGFRNEATNRPEAG